MDLTQIKSLEEEISRMDKLAALGQMAATMAHKIRNPLGGIAGFAGLLQLELAGNDKGKRLVGKITEGVDKLNRIVTSLLSYTAQLRLKTRSVDLRERMEQLTASIAVEFDEERMSAVRFAVEEPSGPVSADIDIEHFSQAMLNVLRNSVEAMDNGGEVTVSVFHGAFSFAPHHPAVKRLWNGIRSTPLMESKLPCAVVIVADNGPGIDADMMEHLFTPFYTTKENGNGLGLAAARKVVEAHHGVLLVESEAGAGTAVGVALPRTSVV
jgi:signal transduction histidine kinase